MFQFFGEKIEKRRKTGGLPLKKKKKKTVSSRYDINFIRETQNEVNIYSFTLIYYYLSRLLV